MPMDGGGNPIRAPGAMATPVASAGGGAIMYSPGGSPAAHPAICAGTQAVRHADLDPGNRVCAAGPVRSEPMHCTPPLATI
jgi:hypothetical protein